jgi:hypothetical protein
VLNPSGLAADTPGAVTYKLWQLFVLAVVPALAAAAVLTAHNRPETAPPTRDAIVEQTPNDHRGAAEASDARSNLRAAVHVLEAYYADTGAYRGATVAELRRTYEADIRGITLPRVGAKTYCLESSVGSATFHKNGPNAEVAKGPCT